MTLRELNFKIEALPEAFDRIECRYLRDERLGILGVFAGMEPTEEQVEIVDRQLFPVDQPLLI